MPVLATHVPTTCWVASGHHVRRCLMHISGNDDLENDSKLAEPDWAWIMIIACRMSLVISLWLGRMHFILSQTEFTLLKTLMEHHFESKVGRVMCWTMAHGTKDPAIPGQRYRSQASLATVWDMGTHQFQGLRAGAQECGVKGERGKQIVSLKKQFALKNELVWWT